VAKTMGDVWKILVLFLKLIRHSRGKNSLKDFYVLQLQPHGDSDCSFLLFTFATVPHSGDVSSSISVLGSCGFVSFGDCDVDHIWLYGDSMWRTHRVGRLLVFVGTEVVIGCCRGCVPSWMYV
jgi:hypothetical protein